MSVAVRFDTLTTKCQKIKQFGKESFVLQSQIFCSYQLSHLMILTLFGLNFCKLFLYEQVEKSRCTTILLIASCRRINELFTFNGVCACKFNDNVKKKTV